MAAAHADLVRRIIGKADVADRAARFPSISKTFPVAVLESYADQPPYYCHYMAWRLARLSDPQLVRFDELLSLAARIGGWEAEAKSLVSDRDFSVFWSLLWQLQVAEFLLGLDYSLTWQPVGPDLRASKDGQTRFIECVTPRKHFGRALFLEELLQTLHPDLRVESQMFLRRSMPESDELDSFLDELVKTLLEPGYLDELVQRASAAYPVRVPVPKGATNLSIYMDGPADSHYDPNVLPGGHGDVDTYWRLILSEAVSNKTGANSLASFRPNAVMVNFLLGHDQQVANFIADAQDVDLGPDIDELIWATVGIRSAVSREDLGSIRGWLP